jgi:hypothetical protein
MIANLIAKRKKLAQEMGQKKGWHLGPPFFEAVIDITS